MAALRFIPLAFLFAIRGSEYPERECCDYWQETNFAIPSQEKLFPVTPPTFPVSDNNVPETFPEWIDSNPQQVPFPKHLPEVVEELPEKKTIRNELEEDLDKIFKPKVVNPSQGILNCEIARKLCREDIACSLILEVLPKVCGQELVACATLTVTKCQAALRTLRAYPLFRPTCLCKEPHIEPECNAFRDFLFDHPCMTAVQIEKDPYPIDALPLCSHAVTVCNRDKNCVAIHDEFRDKCKVKDNQCRMTDKDACYRSWSRLKMSPLFGCICPSEEVKKKCDRQFSSVNHNPCIGSFSLNDSALFSHYPGDLYDLSAIPRHKRNLKVTIETDASNSVSLLCQAAPHVGNHGDAYHATRHGGPSEKMESHHIEDSENRLVNSTSHVGKKASTDDDPGGNLAMTTVPTVTYQSTCHVVLTQCQADMICRRYLDPVLRYCDAQLCNRDSCMQSLQAFYREVDNYWAMEVAFCVCKKTDNANDACLVAQERLHPRCARKPPKSDEVPGCHHLADSCRAHPDCKPRLERFEQACAVDVSTRTCAGPTEGCRRAVVGILGTDLRTSCACRANDVGTVYECIGWQRLLWINPCVIDSHRDYHRVQGNLITTEITPGSTRVTFSKGSSRQTPVLTERTSKTATTVTSTEITEPTSAEEDKTEATTENTPVVTPVPKSCSAMRPNQPEIVIREGSGKRLYREDEPDCSELCICNSGELSCSIPSCVERKPCKTHLAFYTHAGPAYQAYRGECLCYSGSFICARPEPDTYNLAPGVYLFLGYSQTDENLLRPFTGLSILRNVVARMQFLMGTMENPDDESGGKCMLSVYTYSNENVILQARLPELDVARKNSSLTLEKMKQEEDQCMAEVSAISRLIRHRHTRVHEEILLSVIKVVDVGAHFPEPTTSSAQRKRTEALCLLVCILSLVLR